MSFTLKVTTSELRSAATALQVALSEFATATKATQQAAANLTSNWVGDAQRSFESEQANAAQWFAQMASTVETYIAAVNAAATAYEALDIEGVGIIND